MNTRIPEQSETSVYVTVSGHICIEQVNWIEGEPDKVCMSPENIGALCKMLKALKVKAVQAREEHWANEEDKELNGGSK